MAKNENIPEHLEQALRREMSRGRGLLPLHEAAMRLAGLGLNRSQSKTRDLVAMLLGHGARAWRTSQPPAQVHLHVVSPDRSKPVRLRVR
jgi:hypothetical protein